MKQQIQHYRDQGYFIADDAITSDMVIALKVALERCEQKIRCGDVIDDPERIRVNGKSVHSFSHIRALLAPEFEEPVFAQYIASEPILRYVRLILGDQLRLGWVSAFVVDNEPYQVGWHRDIGKEERDGSYDVEMEILSRVRKNTLKWHVALIDDPCLWLVPGSHRRYRTAEEREFLVGGATGELSTGKQIVLKKGQTLFWVGNTIHRGVMPHRTNRRLTLTAALARYRHGDPVEELDERYRWMLANNVRASFTQKGQGFYDNWRLAVGA